ncbi:MAG: hypothetical protein KJ601_01810 [Nanoarchaeota archaeon]|nr:hypothetical protein [Nanoarchaeota archaeon]MBU1704735.1 hypothetical protein [Nanoarchaeota archaeon]
MKKQTISKDTPLAEITLRKYEKPENLSGRDLVRKLCLSLGLLQPGDSRDVVVDVLMVLLQRKEMRLSGIEAEVIDLRKKNKLKLSGVASSNISRQLRRLRDILLVEKVGNIYRITENDKLENIFREKVEQYLISSIIGRVKDYVKMVDEVLK